MQRCARLGGVWEDTLSATHEVGGGRCLTAEEARQTLDADVGFLQTLQSQKKFRLETSFTEERQEQETV